MRRTLAAAVVVAALLVQPPHASASLDPAYSWDVCGGTTFLFCSAVQFHKVGNTLARLDVWNLGGARESDPFAVITRVGVEGLPPRPGNGYNYQGDSGAGATSEYRAVGRRSYSWWGSGSTGFMAAAPS